MATLEQLLDESELRRLDELKKQGILADIKEKDVMQLTWRELAALFSVVSFPFQKVPNSTTASLVIEELTDRSHQRKISLFDRESDDRDRHDVRKHCINCQILGMQKAVDALLDIDSQHHFIDPLDHFEIAETLVDDLNLYIDKQVAFNEDAEHKLELFQPDEKKFAFATRLIPRNGQL